MRILAREKKFVFSKEYLEKYEIKSPSHISQAIKALKKKQIIDEESAKGYILFDDPLFAIWLRIVE